MAFHTAILPVFSQKIETTTRFYPNGFLTTTQTTCTLTQKTTQTICNATITENNKIKTLTAIKTK